MDYLRPLLLSGMMCVVSDRNAMQRRMIRVLHEGWQAGCLSVGPASATDAVFFLPQAHPLPES
jgi:hypothetical protein